MTVEKAIDTLLDVRDGLSEIPRHTCSGFDCAVCCSSYNIEQIDAVVASLQTRTADVSKRLVSDVADGLRKLREPHVAGIDLSEENVMERARNIVHGLLGNYLIETLPFVEIL